MALQLGALREALIEAGASPETAGRAAEELAGHDREFGQLRSEMRDGFSHVEGELAAVRAEMRDGFSAARSESEEMEAASGSDILALRTDARADLLGVQTELKSDIAELRSDSKLLKWMVGAVFAAIVPLLVHTFVR